MPPRGKQNPRTQYFNSISQNGAGRSMDTLRWCLRHGGITTAAEDEDGNTGVQIAAAGGYQNSMEILLEFVRKAGSPKDVEVPDEDGKTPLMLAAHAGKLECVKLLVQEGKAKLHAKCEQGKTAKDYAAARKHEKIVKFLNDPTAPESESEDEVDEAEEQRKRIFRASQKAQGQSAEAAKQEEVHRARVEAAEALEKALASAAKPVWPEVEPILRETRRELSIRGKPPLDTSLGGPVDPAVWSCVCLFDLRLELAERVLTSLPPQIARLTELVTLIVSGNALSALPDELGTLTKLKNLEAAGNELTALPSTLTRLTALQVIDVSNNAIDSLEPISGLRALVALNAGFNRLTSLPLSWEGLEHMQTLAAPSNQIAALPAGVGQLQMLTTLDLSSNQIAQVPIELGNLTVKKLQSVKLQGNPLADPRIRRFVEDDSPSLVKDLLNHVRKHGYKGEAAGGGKKGGKKGKKGKGKAAVVESEDEDDGDTSVADLLAQMAANGSGSDDEPVELK